MSNHTEEVPIAELLVGCLFTLLSVAEFVIYLPCLIVMRTDPDLKSLSCFRMMFHLGLADMLNLVMQGAAGVLFMTRWAYSIPYPLNKFMGAALTAYGWNWYIIVCHVIALNRCVTICLPTKYQDMFFSPTATTIWLALCFAYATVWFVAFVSPWLTFVLIPRLHTFYFDIHSPGYEFALRAAQVADNVFVNGCGIWYIIILVYLRMKSRSMTSESIVTSAQRRERRVFYQAALIGFYTMVWSQYWYFSNVLYFGFKFHYAYAVGNLLWISNSAVNPIVYLTLNKTIQKKVRAMIWKNNAVTSANPNHLSPSNANSRV